MILILILISRATTVSPLIHRGNPSAKALNQAAPCSPTPAGRKTAKSTRAMYTPPPIDGGQLQTFLFPK